VKYNELTLQRGRRPGRVGRGISAGRGKTAGRGTKGQGARKSGGVRSGFEGGQMPLYMRIPKLRGFKSHRAAVQTVYTGQLNDLKKATVDTQTLLEAGLIENPYGPIKLLLKGELKAKKDVKLPAASQSAIAAIQKAGGTFTETNRLPRQPKQAKT